MPLLFAEFVMRVAPPQIQLKDWNENICEHIISILRSFYYYQNFCNVDSETRASVNTARLSVLKMIDVFTNDMEIAEHNGLGKFWIIRLGGVGIGFISIYDLTEKPFIFYAMLPAYRNKGYMKKAFRMIENECSSFLYTIVESCNIPSLKVLGGTRIFTYMDV